VNEADVLRRVIQDGAARAVAVVEAIDNGDLDVARDLAGDLAADLAHYGGRPVAACPYCPAVYRWPGERDAHVERAHPDQLTDDADDAGEAPSRGEAR
jgi:hypothetical protein